MLILHLSDLHVTEPQQNLATSWLRVRRALDDAGVSGCDFVIVSGDLTQRAQPPEYAELQAFLDQQIAPLVPSRDRRRILLVPGNHDVDWSAPIAAPLRLAAAAPAELARVEKELAAYQLLPEASELRVELGRYGHLELLRLDRALYPHRLANVQRFLAGYYGEALGGSAGRRFELLDQSPARHFSAHVFADEGVAFFGFSSVHANDRYWTGAAISPEAIAAASDFARGLDRRLLRVAVWHHGFSAERGRPDSLTAQDLGSLRAAGFRVGFHGHTHRAKVDVSELFDERFAIVSTGSYGAASGDRPDAVGNQFSLVRLNATSLLADVYEKTGEAGTYARARRRYFDLTDAPREPADAWVTHAQVHRRSWMVRKDGIARVTVQLESLRAAPGASLAVLTPPYCNTRAERHAATPRGPVPVADEKLPDGRCRFRLAHAEERFFPSMTWQYVVSNALALDGAELSLLPPRQQWFPNLEQGRELACHTVRFPSDRLELLALYEQDSGARIEEAHALVERQVQREGELSWERIREEEARCVVTHGPGARTQLAVAGPVIGCRYGIAYRLASAGDGYPPVLALNAKDLLRECIGRLPQMAAAPGGDRALAGELFELLIETAGAVLRDRGAVPPQDDGAPLLRPTTTVMGMLWDADRRLLRPAFGNFWPQSWSARFACGDGIAGHSFRFGVPAAYHSEAGAGASERSIIFQPHPHAWSPARSYRWLLSLPLKATGRHSIGVLNIASEEEGGTPVEQHLARLAQTLALGAEEPQDTGLLIELLSAMSATFWTAVAGAETLVEPLRRYARGILQQKAQ